MFKETDDIVRLGKYLYLQIPGSNRCRGCPLLEEVSKPNGKGWCCQLRPSIGLIFDEYGPIKDDTCPRKPGR